MPTRATTRVGMTSCTNSWIKSGTDHVLRSNKDSDQSGLMIKDSEASELYIGTLTHAHVPPLAHILHSGRTPLERLFWCPHGVWRYQARDGNYNKRPQTRGLSITISPCIASSLNHHELRSRVIRRVISRLSKCPAKPTMCVSYTHF